MEVLILFSNTALLVYESFFGKDLKLKEKGPSKADKA